MSEIRTKPANKKYRDNFDRLFRKKRNWCEDKLEPETFTEIIVPKDSPFSKLLNEVTKDDENIDWGEFKTTICVNNERNFGG